MEYLVNKGIIHKDYDLTPAFENGNPTILKKTCVIQPFKEKFTKNNS
jgi:hypothetical protein